MNLPQKIYEECSDKLKGVFIFIDDFQAVKDFDENLNSFLEFFKSIIQSQKNVAYLLSGSMGVKDKLIGDISGKHAAFGGRMLTIEVHPFSFETTKNYILENASSLNFTEDALERFYNCTKGVPAYINMFIKLLPVGVVLDSNRLFEEFKKSLPVFASSFYYNVV